MYGGAADGSGFRFTNCTLESNGADGNGGALYGGGSLEDCVLISNGATNGGAAYATSTTTLMRCNIAEGGASQQGATVYSAGATIEVRDSLVRGFAADASGAATSLVYTDGSSAVAVLDRVTWSNNELGAMASTDDATVVVRNNEGLTASDVQGAALLGCGDPDIIDHCSLEAECTDVATGISCFCFPDNVETDPDLGACSSSGEMSSLVLGSEKMQLLPLSKDNGNATTSLFFPNTGDVFIVWGLAVTKNIEGLNWTASSTKGTLEAGEMQEIVLSLDLNHLQSRGSEYSTEFTLNTTSPSPTPFPISSITTVVVSVIVSASASAVTSIVTMTNLAVLTAAGTVEFVVDSVDAAGVPMLDVSDVVYIGELSADSISDITGDVTCSIIYSAAADHHVGTCAMPGLATGDFTLTVLLGSEMVGGSTYFFTIDRCPVSYVLDDGSGSCTCAAGQYELAGACVACADNHAKPSLGTNKADCVKCETVIGETSNAAHTACDACIEGYYSNGNACVQCPNHPTPCVENSVLMPGYWRATVADEDDDTEVLECRFGVVSCPGTNIGQSGDDSSICLRAKWHHCACGYAGPTCAVCDSTDGGGRFYMAWTSAKCESCDDGTSHGPTIGLACGLCAAGLTVAALAFTKRRRITSSRAYQLIHRIYRIGKVKFSIILFAFQARLQS